MFKLIQFSYKQSIRLRLSIFFFFFLFILVVPFQAFAADGSSVSVTPSIRQIDLLEDKPEYFISYQNRTADTVELKFSASDFSELEDGWKINFLDQKNAELYKFSLSSWIELNTQSMVLKPGEKNDLKVTIKTDRLPAGGHYGSILAQINTFESGGADLKQISLQGTLSSLLFVRANTGQEITSADVFSFSPLQSWWGFPDTIILKIRNTGNTYLSPFGSLEISDPFGRMAGKAILNESSLIVLPETIRSFQLKPGAKSPFLWPGNYRAKLTYHFGDDPNSKTYEATFFSVGNMTPVIIGALIILLILLTHIKKKSSHKH